MEEKWLVNVLNKSTFLTVNSEPHRKLCPSLFHTISILCLPASAVSIIILQTFSIDLTGFFSHCIELELSSDTDHLTVVIKPLYKKLTLINGN